MGGHAGKIAAGVIAAALAVVLTLPILAASFGSYANLDGLEPVERQVAQYYLSQGFSNVSVAAIMANIRQESVGGDVGDGDFNAEAIQDNHTCLAPDSYANCGTSGHAHGLFQLEADGRFQALNELATSKGTTWKDVETQCEYILTEMPYTFEHYSNFYYDYGAHWGGSYDGIAGLGQYMSFDEWKEITDVDWACESFCRVVERAGKPNMAQRKKNAEAYLAILNSGGASAVSGNDVVSRAYAELGKPYVWGAAGPSSFDCSGLVGYCLTGVYGDHWCSTSTIQTWQAVSDPQPGDICINSHHTGIYIGNGQMIHAPHTGDVVKISDVHSDMWYVRYTG